MKLFSNMSVEPVAFVGEPGISQSLDENANAKHVICIGSEFKGQEFFTKAVSHIITATEDDSVLILINTPGGDVESLRSLIGAIRLTKAHVTTRVIGIAASSGFMLWMEGDTMEAADCSCVMIHDAASARKGKLNQMKSSVDAATEQFNLAIQKAKTKGIVTEAEYDSIIAGTDLFISRTTLLERGIV